MAHRVVFGRYGSGKSTFGTDFVKEELLNSDRPIVTTLALNLPELNRWVQDLRPGRDCRVHQRILVLTRAQLAKFWRYRGVKAFGEYGPDPELWGSPDALEGRTYDERWSCVVQGVCYVLDEAPAQFHSRLWSSTGIEFSSYINQHRKFGDDVYSLARHSSMLDKQFRLTADKCIVLDNWYQKSFGRFIKFTAPKRIKYYEYESCPPEKGEIPFNQGSLFIDPKGLSACFNTAGGLGVSGIQGGADIGKTVKGVPWWTSIIAVAAGVMVLAYLAHKAMNVALGRRPRIPSMSNSEVARTNESKPFQILGRLPMPTEVPRGPVASSGIPPGPAVSSLPVCYGYAHINNKVYLDTEDGLLEGRRLVVSNLVVYFDGLAFRHKAKESGSLHQR